MRRSSSAECCCVCLCFANAARARSTASFSAAVPALARTPPVPSHVVVQREEIFGQRADHRARGVAPESEHRSLHMTRANAPRVLPTDRGVRVLAELRGVPTSFERSSLGERKADKLARSILSRSTSPRRSSRARKKRYAFSE